MNTYKVVFLKNTRYDIQDITLLVNATDEVDALLKAGAKIQVELDLNPGMFNKYVLGCISQDQDAVIISNEINQK